ncbi:MULTISPECIES: c-type cytochrome biogenesis protein CcsB [Allobacillus]|uniref:C-type cytochrome biogenesis protein CcsB n=1 Tax=Allobacillus salarius TaxID=1955272 RepID=A0A556PT85_9BACI|nr:c-type cytochrome biogenesis protein CcsB [Allobacillus salarius]TSJ67597.1 c-type cytochrome biogenesis protein CcsB [Allobacillus salarius]
MDFYEISSSLLSISFFIYLIAVVFFGAILGKKRDERQKSKLTTIGIILTIIGFIAQVASFIFRWMEAGHIPVSNMFEFIYFFSMCLIFAFLLIHFIYRYSIMGIVALPIAIVLIGYGSVFPTEVTPLVDSLQSNWLYIHVTTVALAQAILSISFVAGLLYLIVKVNQEVRSKETSYLELIMYFVVSVIAFVVLSFSFGAADYEAVFNLPENGDYNEISYTLPALIGPTDSELATTDHFYTGIEAPSFLNGAEAARKFNSLIWSLLTGLVLYGLLRLLTRKRIGAYLQNKFGKVNPDVVDDILYRAIAIGFPLFTLGGLIFAAIWAQEAWGRFWGWDPKEVWALITWLFYAAFLHLRLARGWHGKKSAWLAVIGFAIIMFNLIVVNLVISGLHSYA